jgi:[protein-PII] uridylyltransferase
MSLAVSIIARRETLAEAVEALADRYWNNEPIEDLVSGLTQTFDSLIIDLWQQHFNEISGCALFAVGGYGRAELHPGSDIDILVLAEKPQRHREAIEAFLRDVFDLNVEVGHSVRDIKTCIKECRGDITVATALFERRFLTGDASLIAPLDKALQHRKIWPIEDFFLAKRDEQVARHRHYDNVDYNLEPNIKTSPGGLRDIHTTLWICNRQFGTTDIEELVRLEVLTDIEARWLKDGKRFLWWVRYGLHTLAGRKEDQLHFARQRELSQRLGFMDTESKSAVELFMQHYYRHVMALSEVNDIILQYFQEDIVAKKKPTMEPLNERFRLVNRRIDVVQPDIFLKNPSAMLEMFLLMAQREENIRVRVTAIRALRDAVHLIDEEFRQNLENCRLFLRILKAPYTVVTQLTRMRRYGVLGRYLPAFGDIVGQMQHDLFHIYTVDAHTMMVIRNMRRFRYEHALDTFPIAHRCVKSIPKGELLYIAGLFHDIGKGRGGDHSELGAEDARVFCEQHELNETDTALVCWLVKRHLYMSSVAQNQDIYDPEVVAEFAREVKSQMRLDYLYALTVADINATNPTLWNGWRATLMRHLYAETRRVFQTQEEPLDRQESIQAFQESALDQLESDLPDRQAADLQQIWQDLGEDFFLRHTTPEIVSLSKRLLEHGDNTTAFVGLSAPQTGAADEGATKIYVLDQDRPKTFAALVVTLSQLGLTVVDAYISRASSDRYFDMFTVLDEDGTEVSDPALRDGIVDRVKATLANPEPATSGATQRVSRQLKELKVPASVSLTAQEDDLTAVLNVTASDRPGLLANIALVLVELGLEITSARITTLGERVEDVFLVTRADGQSLNDAQQCYDIEQAIRQRLDQAL